MSRVTVEKRPVKCVVLAAALLLTPLLPARPLAAQQVSELERVQFVMKGGVVYKRASAVSHRP